MSLTVTDHEQSDGVIAPNPHRNVIQFSVTYLVSTGQLQDLGVHCGIGRNHEFETACDVWQPVLETSNARSAQHNHG